MITEKNPTRLNFEFTLWTRSMVGELIKKKFKVTLNDTTLGMVLRELGIVATEAVAPSLPREIKRR
jgi:transposase